MSRFAPTIAVIIPAYNASATLDRTLRSAVASLRHCTDVEKLSVEAEIIVVDDRSTDDTASIVKRWSATEPSVKLHINAVNRGPGFSRNQGVRQTAAQYLFFLDADDVFYENHIHTCLSTLLADTELGYVFTRMKIDMPMNPEWRESLDESCPINFCVCRVWHDWIKGFAEEDDFRTYRTEDTLYRMCLRKLVKHKKIDIETCEQFISPGNALDRQREKLAMTKADWQKSGISDGFVMTEQMKQVSLDRLMHVEKLTGRAQMFLPIGDDNPHTKFPIVNYTVIAICVAVYAWQFTLTGKAEELFVLTYGLVPGDLFGTARNIDRPSALITVFTSMFMHGGFMHLAGNMFYLWIFGDNIEASLGSARYLMFYLICGIAAGLAQTIAAPGSMVPMIGASGAISGVMGAYMVLHPKANIRIFVWLIIYISVWNIPAFVVLGFWIGGQLLSSMSVDASEPGVAFMAHIGGFIAGAVLVFFFKKRGVQVFEPAHTKAFAHHGRPIRIRRGGSVPPSGHSRGPWT